MLENFIPTLIQDLELGNVTLSTPTPGVYVLPLQEGIAVNMSEITNGYQLKANVGSFPKIKEEIFISQVMLANLFGQGTKGAVLGLNGDGSQLTLTLCVDFPVDYKEFKESLEDFINTMDVWRAETLNPTLIK